MAPTFAYQWIGRIEQGGIEQALLASSTRVVSAKVGDTIDSQWQIERITPTSITLIWLPGHTSQTLAYRPS
ncbi:MAG TPA: hypothetical protein VGE47_13770 [Burkholderiaceae bacterium]